VSTGLGERQVAKLIQDQEVEAGDRVSGSALPLCADAGKRPTLRSTIGSVSTRPIATLNHNMSVSSCSAVAGEIACYVAVSHDPNLEHPRRLSLGSRNCRCLALKVRCTLDSQSFNQQLFDR